MLVLSPLFSFGVGVDAFTTTSSATGLPFTSYEELVDAVDIYLNNQDVDGEQVQEQEQLLLELLTAHGPIESWDVSQITNFSNLFSSERNFKSKSFNFDLSEWDTSSATDLSSMFQGAQAMNFEVSLWDVSNVINFQQMFDSATSFEGYGLTEWNVSSGQNFQEMFRGAIAFGSNPDANNLCSWNDLISPSANIQDMFIDSECPYYTTTNIPEDVTAAARADPSDVKQFCHVCPAVQQHNEDPIGSDVDENKNDNANTSTNNIKRPNILLLMTDQQRFDTIRYVQDELSQYDNFFKIDTPNMDKLLVEGAYFKNAYCQCAVCAPARTTLRTGCTIERTGVQHNDLAEEYVNGYLFQERVESLESIDQILVDNYGYISEYYGKWHMPDLLYKSKIDPTQSVVRMNDYDYEEHDFYFKGDDSSKKLRRYLKQYENMGIILPEQKTINITNLPKYEWLKHGNYGRPQIDTYTKYPYSPIQLDSRHKSEPNTDLTEENGFDSNLRSQPNILGVYSLPDDCTPTHFTGDVAVRALRRLKQSSDPWFLTVSFHNPHPPFVTPWEDRLEKYWLNRHKLFVPPSINDPMDNSAYKTITKELPGYGDPTKIQEWMALYYAMIEEVDDQIGYILDALGDAEDDTLVIFTSDQ
jgi:arylsulfatase A-like enzyme